MHIDAKRFFKYWAPLYVYAAVIFYLSSLSHPLPSVSLPYFDKFLHIVEYAVFGVLACRAFKNSQQEILRRNFKILAVFLAVAYGVSDEFHQLFVACRAYDIFDIMADITGGTIGALYYGRYKPF